MFSIKGNDKQKLLGKFNSKNKEQGGIIGADNAGHICKFYIEKNTSNNTNHSYIPNTKALEKIINKDWASKNIRFIGFVHSHLYNKNISDEDIYFCREFIKMNEIESVLCGIVCYEHDNKMILWYLIKENDCIEINIL